MALKSIKNININKLATPINSVTVPEQSSGVNVNPNMDFQSQLLWLFSFKARQNNHNFNVGTAICEPTNFENEIIFSYENPNDNKSKINFIQAKSKKEKIKINWKTFFTDKEYDLYKYFLSYRNMKKKFNNIENLTICTNNMLARNIEYFKKGSLSGGDDIFKRIGHCYKLTDDTKDILKYNFIAVELIDCILTGDTSYSSLLKSYRKYLTEFIFDKSLKTFNHTFINETMCGNKPFLKILKECVKREIRSAKLDKLELDFLAEIYSEIQNPEELRVQEEEIERDLNEFIEKFLLVVDLDESKLNERMLNELSLEYDIKESDISNNFLEAKINKWVKTTSNEQLTADVINDYFDDFDRKMWLQKLIGMRIPILEDKVPIFKSDVELKQLLNHQSRTSYIFVESDEINLAAIKIYQHAKLNYKEQEDIIYLNTTCSPKIFERGIESFALPDCAFILIIECEKEFDILNKFAMELTNVLRKNKDKTLIVIASPESEDLVKISHESFKKLTISGSRFSDLTEDSIKNILEAKILFQGKEVMWSDLFDLDNAVSLNFPLQYLSKTETIDNETKFFDSCEMEEFIPRKLVHKNIIKPEVENDCKRKKLGEDVIALTKTSLNQYFRRNVDNIHWMKKSYVTIQAPDGQYKLIEQVIWMETFGSISKLRHYVNHEFFFPIQNLFIELDNMPKVMILSGVSGLGKSYYFEDIARDLKECFPNYWVKKIDLDNFVDLFCNLEDSRINSVESAVKFLSEELLHLKSEMDTKVFQCACMETGKAYLFFDGLNEIPCEFRSGALKLFRFLANTRISKIFISIRPDSDDMLESEFRTLKYTLLPFSQENQEDFFVRYWGKSAKLQRNNLIKIAKTVMDVLGPGRKRRVLVEVPLMSRLVAEYLDIRVFEMKDNTSEVNDFCINIEHDKFSVRKMFEYYLNKRLMAYLMFMRGFNQVNDDKEIYDEKLVLVKWHQIVAIRVLLKDIPLPKNLDLSLSEMQESELLQIGIVSKEEDQLKFFHHAFAEYLFGLFCMDNFEDDSFQEFFLDVVLLKNGLTLTRSLINTYILEKMEDKFLEMYGKLMMEQDVTKDTALHVAAAEGNFNILEFLYQSLLLVAGKNCENILFAIGEEFKVFLCEYLMNSDNIELVHKISSDLGEEVAVDLLSYSTNCQTNPFITTIYNKNNLIELLKFLKELKLEGGMEKVFLSTDMFGNTILHKFTMYYNIAHEKMFDLMEFLGILKENVKGKLLKSLLIVKNRTGLEFFDFVGLYQSESDLLKVFEWLTSEFDFEFYSEHVLFKKVAVEKILGNAKWDVVSFLKHLKTKVSIIKIMEVFKKLMVHVPIGNLTKMLDWIRSEETNLFTEILLPADQNSDAFLHWATTHFKKVNDLVEILNYLQRSINPETFKIILQKENQLGKTFLHNACEKLTNMVGSDLKILLDWVAENNNTYKRIFSTPDKNNNTFLHVYVVHGNLNKIEIILNYLKQINLVEEIILKQNRDKQSIVHMVNSTYHWMILLQWIKVNLGQDQFKRTILLKDKNKELFFSRLKDQYIGVLVELLYYLKGCTKYDVPSGILNYTEEKIDDIPTILKWIDDFFGRDFYKNIVLFEDESKDTLLSWFVEKKNPQLFKFLDSLKSKFDKNKMKDILTKYNDSYETFLYLYCENYGIQEVITLLEWIKTFDAEFYKKVILSEGHDETLLQQVSRRDVYELDIFLDYLKKNIGDENQFKEYLMKKGISSNQTFLQISSMNQSPYNFKNILLWLKNELPERSFVALFLPDAEGGTLLHYVAQSFKYGSSLSILIEILSWLDSEFVSDIILFKDDQEKLFFNYLPLNLFQEMLTLIKSKFSARTLRDVIFTRINDRQTCLHHYAETVNDDEYALDNFMTFIKWLVENFDSNRLGKLCTFKRLDEKTFLHVLLTKRSQAFFETLDIFTPVLGTTFLKGILMSPDTYANGVFHILLEEELENDEIVTYFERVLDLFTQHFGIDFCKTLLELENISDRTFLYILRSNFRSHEDISSDVFSKILNLIFKKTEKDKNLMEKILTSTDRYGQNLLHFFAEKSMNLCLTIMEHISEYLGVEILKRTLLCEDKQKRSVVVQLFSKRIKDDNIELLLDFILKKLSSNEEFFTQYGSKKNFIIRMKSYPRIGGRSIRAHATSDHSNEETIFNEQFSFEGIPNFDKTNQWKF